MAERANDISPGQVLEHNGGLFSAKSIMHTQAGKGGSYTQAEMRNVKTGAKHYERFRSDATIRRAIFDEDVQVYFFTKENIVYLKHPSNYEQIVINLDLLGEKKAYLQDNMKIKVVTYQYKIISAHVPDHVTLTVKETESFIIGQTVTASYKPAIMENGIRVSVPQFIKEGDKIVVHTSDNSYYEINYKLQALNQHFLLIKLIRYPSNLCTIARKTSTRTMTLFLKTMKAKI